MLPLVCLLRLLSLTSGNLLCEKSSLLFVIKEIEVLIKASGKPCTKRAGKIDEDVMLLCVGNYRSNRARGKAAAGEGGVGEGGNVML